MFTNILYFPVAKSIRYENFLHSKSVKDVFIFSLKSYPLEVEAPLPADCKTDDLLTMDSSVCFSTSVISGIPILTLLPYDLTISLSG